MKRKINFNDNILILEEEPLPNVVYDIGGGRTLRIRDGAVVIGDVEVARVKSEWVGSALKKWTDLTCPDVGKIDWMFDNSLSQKKLIVKGYVQSGKTAFVICCALRYMFSVGISSIIVLRDAIGDYTQIKHRIAGMKASISEFVGADVEIVVLDSKTHCDDVRRAVDGGVAKLFVVLGNNCQLKRINDAVSTADRSKYAVFIDEADSNDTGENIRVDELTRLKDRSSRLFYISATILDIGFRDDGGCDDVYILGDVAGYNGIDKLIHQPLDQKLLYIPGRNVDPYDVDPNMSDFLSGFSRKTPHDTKFGIKHPRHCLMTVGSTIMAQQKVFSRIAASYRGIAVIIYNGDGVDVFHSSLVGKTFNVKKFVSRPTEWFEGAVSFSNGVGIADIIQLLKDNGGVDVFPRIITISGRLAGRGISFVSSDYGLFMNAVRSGDDVDFIGWRLTSMYYTPSKSTTQPNIMQTVGRLCCVCVDDIQTEIYTRPDVFADLTKAYWTQEELITRARENQSIRGTSLESSLKDVQMNFMKLSKRRLTGQSVKRLDPSNIVTSGDGGFDLSCYNETIETFEEEGDMSKKEFDRLTIKRFPVWATGDSHVSKFMSDLDPNKSYSLSDFKELCLHSNVRVLDLVGGVKGNKYGSVIERVGSTYRLHPALVDSYLLHF